MIPKMFRFRTAIEWTWAEPISEESFILVKRVLKLFPFETLSVEVDYGRSRDVFSDWDSYIEWFKAEKPNTDRLFSRIQISRQKKMLGLMVWEKDKCSGVMELAVYTEHDQIAPIVKACETMEHKAIRVFSSKANHLSRFKRFQEWAFSFFSSSVRRGTTSKRSPTIP